MTVELDTPNSPALAAAEGAGVHAVRAHTRALNHLAFATEILVVVALVFDLAITFANAIGRYAFNAGITKARFDAPYPTTKNS